MATLAIDFDGVLCSDQVKPGMRMGLPVDGAIEAMQAMAKAGHTLVIFTVRGNNPKHVRDWLKYYSIPFSEVTNIKNDFDLILDDKACHFTSWGELRSLWA